ncbi:MAG TPA: transglycosylase SLT domain-containing protein [Candidatus Methylomirabilis sp.]|nr:transglycosylase SLT domain-containing protein [Candidatus Methylomirabilis sp.]
MPRWIAAGLMLICLATRAMAGEAPVGGPEAVLDGAARDAQAGNITLAIQSLQTLEAAGVPATIQPRADLLLGILLLKQDKREEAIPPLERAATTYPLLADYALYSLAAANRLAGRPAAAALALRRLLDGYPDSLFVERASREIVRDWLEAGELARVEETAGRYLAAFPQASGRAGVWVALGEALLRSGRAEQAEAIFRRVWIELPGSPDAQRAKDLLATIPGARPFTPEEQFRRAMTAYQVGRYGQALHELVPFATVGDPHESQARLLLGISAFNLRQYGQATKWLLPLRDAAGVDRGEVAYWLGRSYGRAGDYPRFTEQMLLLADMAPQTRRGEEALYLLAQAAANEGEVAQARTYLTRLVQEYPKGVLTDAGLWLQGWLAKKAGEPAAALAAWGRLLAEQPGSSLRAPALYWRGRVLEAEKHSKDAVKAYRTLLETILDQPYYRFRAEERLARLGKKAVAPAAVPAKRAATADHLHLKKAEALRSLGLPDEATDEYSEQIRVHPEDRVSLGETCRAFLDLQRYDKAVWMGGRILRPLFVQENGQPPIREFWQCLYPLGHFPVVRQQAAQQGLDPYLVTALIREESAFAPRAVSRAGARGLMQLMPETAEQVARRYKVRLPSAPPLESPEVNIQLGTMHLAELLRDNGGSLSLAIASYNAGRQQVQRWIQRFGFTTEEEFTEDIPYNETRNYVKRVLGSYERYTSLYGKKRAESREPGAARVKVRHAAARRPHR